MSPSVSSFAGANAPGRRLICITEPSYGGPHGEQREVGLGRGEVGAGVLIISLSYGIGGPIVIIAMLSLALNLVLTGVFILIVKRLLASAAKGDGGVSGLAAT